MAFDWGSAIGGLASLGSAYLGSKGAKDAGKAAAAGSEAGNKVIWDMFQQNRADQQPFMQAGLSGMNEYMRMLGLSPTGAVSASGPVAPAADLIQMQGGAPGMNAALYSSDPAYKRAWDEVVQHHRNQSGTQQFTPQTNAEAIRGHVSALYGQYRPQAQQQAGQQGAYSAQQITDRLRATPGYQFAFNEGQRGLESSAAARGGLFSGAAGKALTKYGQGMADQQYGTHLNRLASLAGIGQTATNTVGGWGQNAASNVATGLQNAGNARASGIANSANQWQQGMNNAAGFFGDWYGGR